MSRPYPAKVTVVHGGSEFEINVEQEIAIDPNNLIEAFTKHPGQYAWYATVHAGALHALERAKMALEIAQSKAAARLREDRDERGKAPSETAIASMLPNQPEVKKAQAALIEARHQEAVLKAVREAFSHRRDMLLQLGANERLEKQSYNYA